MKKDLQTHKLIIWTRSSQIYLEPMEPTDVWFKWTIGQTNIHLNLLKRVGMLIQMNQWNQRTFGSNRSNQNTSNLLKTLGRLVLPARAEKRLKMLGRCSPVTFSWHENIYQVGNKINKKEKPGARTEVQSRRCAWELGAQLGLTLEDLHPRLHPHPGYQILWSNI